MQHARIRALRAADVAEALEMFAEVAAEGIWLGTQAGFDRHVRRQAWLDGLADPSVRSLVVEEVGPPRLVGQGIVRVARYGVAELGMSLAADARGRGLGGQLLDELLVSAGELGAHKAELQVWPHNEPAIRLYLSRGFIVEGRVRSHYRRASGEVWDAILMGRLLDQAPPDSARGSGLPDAPGLPASIPITHPGGPGSQGSGTRNRRP